jgi:hypothetical protein
MLVITIATAKPPPAARVKQIKDSKLEIDRRPVVMVWPPACKDTRIAPGLGTGEVQSVPKSQDKAVSALALRM